MEKLCYQSSSRYCLKLVFFPRSNLVIFTSPLHMGQTRYHVFFYHKTLACQVQVTHRSKQHCQQGYDRCARNALHRSDISSCRHLGIWLPWKTPKSTTARLNEEIITFSSNGHPTHQANRVTGELSAKDRCFNAGMLDVDNNNHTVGVNINVHFCCTPRGSAWRRQYAHSHDQRHDQRHDERTVQVRSAAVFARDYPPSRCVTVRSAFHFGSRAIVVSEPVWQCAHGWHCSLSWSQHDLGISGLTDRIEQKSRSYCRTFQVCLLCMICICPLPAFPTEYFARTGTQINRFDVVYASKKKCSPRKVNVRSENRWFLFGTVRTCPQLNQPEVSELARR